MKRRLLTALLPTALLALCLLSGCVAASPEAAAGRAGDPAPGEGAAGLSQSAHPADSPGGTETAGAAVVGTMPLRYAEQFSVEYRADGSALLTVAGADRFLILPADAPAPAAPEPDARVLRRPLGGVYLASSSAADFFVQLDSLSALRFTSTLPADWGIPEVRAALDAEQLLYAGKYSAPDFELLLEEGCTLAVENTMIFHSPDIREKLEALGIPVLVERSSYETHPLGRMEWIKVYGLLLDREEEASRFFERQLRLLESLDTQPAGGKTAAFFHINSVGAAVVRKPGDYVSRMIALAGGRYVFDTLPGADENNLSTMNMQMEAFYAGAREADVLIYNSSIAGELESLAQLLEKSPLLADFRAVQTGNVWCTEHDMFQKSSAAVTMIADFNTVLSAGPETPDRLTFLYRLK